MIDKLYSDFLHEKGFECRSYYDSNYRGLEDSETYDVYSGMEDWVWDKLQDGLYVEVNGVRFNPDLVAFGDETYGIEDYLDESVSNKNSKKVNEDYGTDTSDIDGMLDAVLDFVYTYDYWDNDAIDPETGYFTEDAVEKTRDMLENRDPALADYLESYVNDFVEDGEKFDGKIADIIDYLRGRDSDEDKLHSMAMKNEDFNKVNTSDFDKWCLKNVAPKVKEEVAKIKKQIKSGAIDTDDIDGIVSAIATNIFNLVTDAVAPYVDKKQTNEAYVEYDNTITSEQMDDAIEEGYPVKVVINGEYYDYKSMRKYESVKNKKLKEAYSGVDLNESVEDEAEADDDFTDGEAETDESMNESLAGFKKLPVKSFDRNPSEQTQVPQTAELEDEVADESFAHDDSM